MEINFTGAGLVRSIKKCRSAWFARYVEIKRFSAARLTQCSCVRAWASA
jgi:hypothetical protein